MTFLVIPHSEHHGCLDTLPARCQLPQEQCQLIPVSICHHPVWLTISRWPEETPCIVHAVWILRVEGVAIAHQIRVDTPSKILVLGRLLLNQSATTCLKNSKIGSSVLSNCSYSSSSPSMTICLANLSMVFLRIVLCGSSIKISLYL